jgi:hypothetical protein
MSVKTNVTVPVGSSRRTSAPDHPTSRRRAHWFRVVSAVWQYGVCVDANALGRFADASYAASLSGPRWPQLCPRERDGSGALGERKLSRGPVSLRLKTSARGRTTFEGCSTGLSLNPSTGSRRSERRDRLSSNREPRGPASPHSAGPRASLRASACLGAADEVEDHRDEQDDYEDSD